VFTGHSLMENRNRRTWARWPPALRAMPGGAEADEPHADRPQPADKGYDTGTLPRELARERSPRCRSKYQRPPFGDRWPHHPLFRHAVSQRIRRPVEEAFGYRPRPGLWLGSAMTFLGVLLAVAGNAVAQAL